MGSSKLKFNRNAAQYYNGKKYAKQQAKEQKIKELYCVKCGKNVSAVCLKGKFIYPDRPDLYERKYWQCPTCKNYCAYGTLQVSIPTPELRKARRKIHIVIDPLWQSGMVSRGWVYKHMSEFAGKPYHNGTLNDLGEAKKMYDAALKVRDMAILEHETKVRERGRKR